MQIVAIDPGPAMSAFVAWDGDVVAGYGKIPNEDLIQHIRLKMAFWDADALVIEKIASYGQAVGEEVFETVFWTGRFAEAFGGVVERVPRKKVSVHLCNTSKAGDANVRQAVIDRFGGKDLAIGRQPKNKKEREAGIKPGPLNGFSGDCWAALALALTWWDLRVDGIEKILEHRELVVTG